MNTVDEIDSHIKADEDTSIWIVEGLQSQPDIATDVWAPLRDLIGADRLQTLHEQQFTAEFYGRPLVITGAQDPGSDDTLAYLLWVSDFLLPHNPLGASLDTALKNAGALQVMYRLTPDQYRAACTAWPEAEGGLAVSYLRWIPQPDEDIPLSDGITIRPTRTAEERQFVVELARLASRRGLGGLRPDIEPEKLDNLITEDAETFDGVPITSYVGYEGQQPVGMVMWSDELDDLTGESFIELIDIGVPKHEKGRGIAHALTQVATHAALEAGCPLIGSVVRESDGTHRRILSGILGEGKWEVAYVLAQRPDTTRPDSEPPLAGL